MKAIVFCVSHLQTHFYCEHDSENIVEDVQHFSFQGPRRNVGPFHGQSDAVARDEHQNDKVEPGLLGKRLATEAEPAAE